MNAATKPRARPHGERLLAIDPHAGTFRDATIAEVPELLARGDLLIVNDAATMPASLAARTAACVPVEMRLAHATRDERVWQAIAFGGGDWRTPTEQRPSPPALVRGEVLEVDGGLAATIVAVDATQPRLVTVRFDRGGAALWGALYRGARPIQYAYLERPLELWDVQNRFASRPWALESPSAGLPLTWDLLLQLRARGVDIAALTHAAGISSTGSSELDRRLPFAERYELPQATVDAVLRARTGGGRIIAAGTTVVRALEDAAARDGGLRAGVAEARLVIGPGFRRRVVDGLLTGMHEDGTSHHMLMQAFAPAALLRDANAYADAHDYLQHEFGDVCLIIPGRV